MRRGDNQVRMGRRPNSQTLFFQVFLQQLAQCKLAFFFLLNSHLESWVSSLQPPSWFCFADSFITRKAGLHPSTSPPLGQFACHQLTFPVPPFALPGSCPLSCTRRVGFVLDRHFCLPENPASACRVCLQPNSGEGSECFFPQSVGFDGSHQYRTHASDISVLSEDLPPVYQDLVALVRGCKWRVCKNCCWINFGQTALSRKTSHAQIRGRQIGA